jgi:hypothetical protein
MMVRRLTRDGVLARGVLAAILLLGAPCVLYAQTDLLAALSAAERRAADTVASLREREQAMDRAIELRRQVIARAAETEDRLPGLLMDQSAALLSRLARDGSDTAVLFGLALPPQRAAAAAAAEESAALLVRAERLLEGEREDDHDRSVRLPFYRARAELLLAALADEENRQRHSRRAHDLIGRMTLSNTGPEAVRRVNLGLSLLMRGGDAGDAQVALDEFGWVAMREGDDAAAIPALIRAEAWMGLLHASSALARGDVLLGEFQRALSGPPFVGGEGADALLVVLATDAATRALFEQALRGRDSRMLELAARQQGQLLARSDLPLRAESLRPLVYEKLALLADRALGAGEIDLPAAMRIARAVVLARDPELREAAIAILREVCAEPAGREFAGDAHWELAVLLTQLPGAEPALRMEAARALLRLADEFDGHPRAGEAMAAALSHARALVIQDRLEAARPVYVRALELATTRYPRLPEIGLWRYERARLILEDFETGEGALAHLEGALELLSLGELSSIAADAARLAERLHIARLDELWSQARELRRQGELRALAALARERLVPAAQQALSMARSAGLASLDRFRLDLADALLEARESAAKEIYQDLVQRLERRGEGAALLLRARLGLGRAHAIAGDAAAAFVLLRAVAQDTEHLAATEDHVDEQLREAFWHAWTLMIEILSRQDDDTSRVGAIRVHIRRLQGIDPDLGGPPWRERILAALPRE